MSTANRLFCALLADPVQGKMHLRVIKACRPSRVVQDGADIETQETSPLPSARRLYLDAYRGMWKGWRVQEGRERGQPDKSKGQKGQERRGRSCRRRREARRMFEEVG